MGVPYESKEGNMDSKSYGSYGRVHGMHISSSSSHRNNQDYDLTSNSNSPQTILLRDVSDEYHQHNSELNSSSINNKWTTEIFTFCIGDVIDVFDEREEIWNEAKVISINHQDSCIHVRFIKLDTSKEYIVHNIEKYTAPLHTFTFKHYKNLQIGQRVEILSGKKSWKHAFIKDIHPKSKSAYVHYEGCPPFLDEWIEDIAHRVRPYRNEMLYPMNETTKSNRNGKKWAIPMSCNSKYDEKNMHNNTFASEQRIRRIENTSNKFEYYRSKLFSDGFILVPVLGDGNCLFRSVSHQIYKTDQYHDLIRQSVMDYMELHADFYSSFIEGGLEQFPFYINAKRMNACWGDDPEIQAICEIYNRRAEIWTYDANCGAKKLRTFHEIAMSCESNFPPIRLSFYGGGHYDSIVPLDNSVEEIHLKPGQIEAIALKRNSQNEVTDFIEAIERSRQEINRHHDLESALAELISTADLRKQVEPPTQLNKGKMIDSSADNKYENKDVSERLSDLDLAMQMSEDETLAFVLKQSIQSTDNLQYDDVNLDKQDDEAILNQVIASSILESNYEKKQTDDLYDDENDELMLAIEASLKSYHS